MPNPEHKDFDDCAEPQIGIGGNGASPTGESDGGGNGGRSSGTTTPTLSERKILAANKQRQSLIESGDIGDVYVPDYYELAFLWGCRKRDNPYNRLFPEPKEWQPRVRPPWEVRSRGALETLMENRGVLSYGRRKVWSRSDDTDESTDRVRWAANYPEQEAVTAAFPDGGWHVEKAGSTGSPVGRPARGLRDTDLLRQWLCAGIGAVWGRGGLLAYCLTPKKQRRRLDAMLIAAMPKQPNTKALAETMGYSERKTRMLNEQATVFAANAPKGGEAFLQDVKASLARIENKLDHEQALMALRFSRLLRESGYTSEGEEGEATYPAS